MKQEILIASDHAGWALKSQLIQSLSDLKWLDLGPMDLSKVDYPDYAQKLCEALSEALLKGSAKEGILICGSGIGMSIAANKFPGIRAAVVENPVAARLAREHNHANVLCLGSRFVAPEYAVEIVQAWLNTSCSQDIRHLERIKKLQAIEQEIKRRVQK